MPDDRSGSPGLQLDHAASHFENWTSLAQFSTRCSVE